MPTYQELSERIADLQMTYPLERRVGLERRRRAADNKDKGTEFERHYGVYLIMLEVALFLGRQLDGHSGRISNNLTVEVDDIFVLTDDHMIFCQVKDRQELYWPEVADHFRRHRDDLRAFGLAAIAELRLVVSRAEVARTLNGKFPADLREVVRVVHFDNVDGEFEEIARPLLSPLADEGTLENMRHHIYDAWRTLEFGATLNAIMRRASRLSCQKVMTLDRDVELDQEEERKLARVNGLDRKIVGQRFWYGYSGQNLAPAHWDVGTDEWKNFIGRLPDAGSIDYIRFLGFLGGRQ